MGMTSSTRASLRQPASRPPAPSATPCRASTVPRTARLTACLVGASLAACPAPRLRSRLSLVALASPRQRPTLANRRQVSWQQFERLFQYCVILSESSRYDRMRRNDDLGHLGFLLSTNM